MHEYRTHTVGVRRTPAFQRPNDSRVDLLGAIRRLLRQGSAMTSRIFICVVQRAASITEARSRALDYSLLRFTPASL
jgi:hypothetical protein